MTERVEIFTDGACSGNPGPGGWGAILRYKGTEKELKGGANPTTNNRMEMMAAIAALEALKRPSHVVVHTDSQYLKDGITRWLPQWKARGWKHRGQEAGQEHRSVEASRVRARDPSRSNGAGCAAIPAIPRTSAPTRSPAPPSSRPATRRRWDERGAPFDYATLRSG